MLREAQESRMYSIQIRKIFDSETKKLAIKLCDHAFMQPVSTLPEYASLFEKIDQNALFLVAVENNTIVGYAAMYANGENSPMAFITLLAVVPEKQGCHIGSALLNCCEENAVKLGMKKISLQVRRENLRAIRFYEKRGYLQCSEKASEKSLYYYKTLE